MNICAFKYLFEYKYSSLLGIYLGVELLSHTVILKLYFWGAAKLSSTVAASFCISTAMHEGSHLHTLVKLAILVIFDIFDYSHPCGHEVVSHYCFDLHFSNE